jgi:hypothetical protein
MDELTANVERGMKFLDERISNWTDAIDIDRLRLSSCSRCVLGQLFKDFHYGIDHLDISSTARSLGFNVKQGIYADEQRIYKDLTKAWIAALKKRKEEQNV